MKTPGRIAGLQSRLMADYDNRWVAGNTKFDEHRSRVPDASDRGSTFHSEETLVLVYDVTLAPGTWPLPSSEEYGIGGNVSRGISLQRPLTFSFSYMSSISGATLVPCWCHPRVAPGGTNMAHPVAVD